MSTAKLNRYGAMAALMYAGLAGCQSSDPVPEGMARTTLQTAPADLQLVCADAAAKAAGGQGTKVLPTSSQQVDARTYSVDLDASGRRFRCLVDDQGTVTSLQPA